MSEIIQNVKNLSIGFRSKKGEEIIILKNISTNIIASGGAGSCEDVYNLISKTGIQNISASSIFHFTEITPTYLKKYLKQKGLNIRQ